MTDLELQDDPDEEDDDEDQDDEDDDDEDDGEGDEEDVETWQVLDDILRLWRCARRRLTSRTETA